jgi:hypothetical protein
VLPLVPRCIGFMSVSSSVDWYANVDMFLLGWRPSCLCMKFSALLLIYLAPSSRQRIPPRISVAAVIRGDMHCIRLARTVGFVSGVAQHTWDACLAACFSEVHPLGVLLMSDDVSNVYPLFHRGYASVAE